MHTLWELCAKSVRDVLLIPLSFFPSFTCCFTCLLSFIDGKSGCMLGSPLTPKGGMADSLCRL